MNFIYIYVYKNIYIHICTCDIGTDIVTCLSCDSCIEANSRSLAGSTARDRELASMQLSHDSHVT